MPRPFRVLSERAGAGATRALKGHVPPRQPTFSRLAKRPVPDSQFGTAPPLSALAPAAKARTRALVSCGPESLLGLGGTAEAVPFHESAGRNPHTVQGKTGEQTKRSRRLVRAIRKTPSTSTAANKSVRSTQAEAKRNLGVFPLSLDLSGRRESHLLLALSALFCASANSARNFAAFSG